jgi:hypothetical protein
MLTRILLACCLLWTGVHGPAFCCCTPILSVTPAKSPRPDKPKGCPHCRETAAPAPGYASPDQAQSPQPKTCHCRHQQLAAPVTDSPELRAAGAENLPDFATAGPLDARLPGVPALSLRSGRAGPPPLPGIDRSQRHFVLTC